MTTELVRCDPLAATHEATQLPLPLFADLDTDDTQRSLTARFWKFHRENGHVYRALVRYAREAKAAGRKRVGIALLFERLRWYTTVETQGSEWRLDNSFRSRYARLLAAQEPDLAELFETRRLHGTFDAEGGRTK